MRTGGVRSPDRSSGALARSLSEIIKRRKVKRTRPSRPGERGDAAFARAGATVNPRFSLATVSEMKCKEEIRLAPCTLFCGSAPVVGDCRRSNNPTVSVVIDTLSDGLAQSGTRWANRLTDGSQRRPARRRRRLRLGARRNVTGPPL